MGFNYGPAFRCVKAIYNGNGVLVAELSLASALANSQAEYVLHPCIMNGALQASIELFETDTMPGRPLFPIALESLRIYSACTNDMFAVIRYSSSELQSEDGLFKVDIDLCDLQGNLCVQINALSLRQIALTASFQASDEISVPINTSMFPASASSKPRAIQLNGFAELNSGSMSAAKPQAIQLADTETNDKIASTPLPKPVSVQLPGSQGKAELLNTAGPIPRKLHINGAGFTTDTPDQTISSIDKSSQLLKPSRESNTGFILTQLQDQLKTSLAEALYLKPSEIDIDKAFVDLGLDSIIGVEWIKVINKQLGLEVSATRVYDYSNIRALAS